MHFRSTSRPRWRAALALLALVGTGAVAQVAPSNTGQSGFINMPDGRIAPEGSWRSGMSYWKPYQTIWSSIAVLPWLESSFRYVRFMGAPTSFTSTQGGGFGDLKDKAVDIKLRAIPESDNVPSISFGLQDAQGTQLTRAFYGAVSKRIGELDLTLGYGTRRIDGAFGGLRWSPHSLPDWSFVAEYDANNYPKDPFAAQTGAINYSKGPAYGVEYRWGWLGAKAFTSNGQFGFNAYVSVPLEQREFIPKFEEPAPYTRLNPRPTETQWAENGVHRARLARALAKQDFADIRIAYTNGRLEATLANTRISTMPRAVGRAARTLLAFAPLEVREIRVTYEKGSLPVATYTFIHIPTLQRYFNGMASRKQLAEYVAVEYAQPVPGAVPGGDAASDRDLAIVAAEEPLPTGLTVTREGGDLIALKGDNFLGGKLRVRPALGTYLNDPSGAFKYEIAAVASWDRPMGDRLFLQAETKLNLIETVSDVTQPSNSTLPHVRSDVANYKRGGRFKVTRLLANKFFHPSERLYGRLSGGIYEEMFSGAGGQVLYLPRSGSWAIDLAVDGLKQRDFRGLFGHRDYSVLTAIASLNYRMAHGITGTLRAGQFLAKDKGVRVEVKRRFRSGFEVGAWYSFTDGKDITSPGSPSNPYQDKGIFMSMPLETMLTQDSTATAGFALAPWTRDVGQMVASPGDLYRLLESPVLQFHARDGLVRFGDREDDYQLPSLGTSLYERRWPSFLANDLRNAGRAAGEISWWEAGLFGLGVTAASSVLDKRAYRFADKHQTSQWLKNGERYGDLLPLAALGVSVVFAFDESRPNLSDAGVAALEAGVAAIVLSTGLKYAFGRARPNSGLRDHEFKPGNTEARYHAMPSRHTAAMFAAVTPYAKEYGMPWLYGVAGLTALGRIGSREHWLSDTVAGGLVGYALGHMAWDARRASRLQKDEPRVLLGPNSVHLSWALD